MNSIKISTMKEYDSHRQTKGYKSDITDLCYMLGVSLRKARTLLKNAPRIELSESLYQQVKKKESEAARVYYRDSKVVSYLIENDVIEVSYHDPREAYINDNPAGVQIMDKQFLIDNIGFTTILLSFSRTVKEFIINDNGYEFLNIQGNKEVYIHDGDQMEIKYEGEIYSKSDVVKYTNLIKRGFFIRFKVGERTVKYIQSQRLINEKGFGGIVRWWLKKYDAECNR